MLSLIGAWGLTLTLKSGYAGSRLPANPSNTIAAGPSSRNGSGKIAYHRVTHCRISPSSTQTMDLLLEPEVPSLKRQMEVTAGNIITGATEDDLYGVSFTNPNIGTVVGNFGAILRTTDAGSHWTIQTRRIQ